MVITFRGDSLAVGSSIAVTNLKFSLGNSIDCNQNVLSSLPIVSLRCMTSLNGFVLTVTGLPAGIQALPVNTHINLSLSQIQYPSKMSGPSIIIVLRNSTEYVISAGVVQEGYWGPTAPANFLGLSVRYDSSAEIYRSNGLIFTFVPSISIQYGAILINLPQSFTVLPNTTCDIGSYSYNPVNNVIQISYITVGAGNPLTFTIKPIMPNKGARQLTNVEVNTYTDNYNIFYVNLVHNQSVLIPPAGQGIYFFLNY